MCYNVSDSLLYCNVLVLGTKNERIFKAELSYFISKRQHNCSTTIYYNKNVLKSAFIGTAPLTSKTYPLLFKILMVMS